MKLLLIRHGSPDYEHDCLTEKGREEAALLAGRIAGMKIDGFYSSPMGRARETMQFTLDRVGRQGEVLDWLHEFDIFLPDEKRGGRIMTWDVPPGEWMEQAELFDKDSWQENSTVKGSDMTERYRAVQKGLDKLLEENGLTREGGCYRVTGEHDKTLALYCHFGATCVVMAHLLNLSPMLAVQSFSADPTAVAVLCTDDRFDGKVNFRLHLYGDTSHLGRQGGGTLKAK
ncbi:MAG: histidine phosphatase family protein [Ruminococcus sp.]|nr:histidine phosphatase family protein [Ruminococcus sp.]